MSLLHKMSKMSLTFLENGLPWFPSLFFSVITVRSEPAQATRIPPSYWCISRVQNKNTNTLSKTVSDKQPSAPVKRSQSHRKTHMTCTARRVEMCNGGRPS